MGRLLKRMPLGFDAPIGETWQGYVNPFAQHCPTCYGQCSTPARQWLDSIVHLLLMTGEAAIDEKPLHPWLISLRTSLAPNERPSSEMADLTGGLAGRPPRSPFGHDAIDQWTATKKIVQAAGLDDSTWGWCPACKGSGIDPANAEAYEAWTRTEPPTGEGYQLWENTTEGSPVSPVFASLDDLCAWAETNATTFGSNRASANEWKAMLLENNVCHREGQMIFI